MNARDAEAVLAGAPLVPVAQGSIRDLKRLVEQLLDNDVPATLGAPEGGCASGSCSPKALLLAREEDVRRVAEVMQRDWMSLVEADGASPARVGVEVADDEELPCPACGTAAPLVEGACSDCGLHLG